MAVFDPVFVVPADIFLLRDAAPIGDISGMFAL